LFNSQRHNIQYATLGVAIFDGLEFATSDVANLRDTVKIDRVKGSEVAQIGGGETAAVFVIQLCRKLFYNLLAVFGPFISPLDFLHDFSANQPMRYHHIVVNGSNNIGACLFQNRYNPIKQVVALRPHEGLFIGIHGSHIAFPYLFFNLQQNFPFL
jgi:hypothetical protein